MKNVLNKIINICLVFGIMLSLLPINIYAEETTESTAVTQLLKGVIKSSKGDGINLREGPGVDYNRVGGLDDGRVVDIVSEVATDDGTDSVCASWYKIIYSTGYAYACKSYVNLIELIENPLYNYEEELAKFPASYKTYIEELHKIYPNAIFVAENTSNKDGSVMDFKTAVTNEDVPGKSLIWDSYPNNYRNGLKSLETYNISTNSFNNSYPGGGSNWYAANYDTIAYYMDPRNFLNEKRVFMFESQLYNSNLHTASGVETVLSGSYMHNQYVDGSEKTFSQTIIDAAIYSGLSPYFIASRILQEVGTTRSALVLGTYPNYPEFNGYYNYYNISAGGDNVVYNGLAKAKASGWNSEYKAIVYGSSWIGNEYTNSGQDTGYEQKWDVMCKGKNSCYNHQYMQNIEAPYSEALSTYNAYKKNSGDSMYLNPYVFYIPVYANMPDTTVLPNSSDPINYLSSITIDKTLIANFDSTVEEYNLTIPYSKTAISIEATSVSSSASITGTGNVEIKEDKKDIEISVKALNGSLRKYIIHVTREEKKDTSKMTLAEAIAGVEGVKFTDTTIAGITSVGVLKEKINATGNNVSVSVKNKNGEIIQDGNLGTGYTVNLSLNEEAKDYQIILYGDTNGDAEITILDLLRVQKQLLKSISLTGAEYSSADVNKDGEVTILDLLLVQKHLLGSKYISQ